MIRNLGLGGACVECDEPFSLGEALEISLPIATRWEPLDLAGTVVWVRDSRIGLSFVQATSSTHLADALPLLLEALTP